MLVNRFGSEIGNAGESPRLVAAAGRSSAWKARGTPGFASPPRDGFAFS